MEIYKRLLTYLAPYKARLAWSVVFMGLTSALVSAQAYLVKPVLDKVILAKNMELGLLLPPALVLVTILKGTAAYGRDYLMGWVGQKIVNDIRDQLYACLADIVKPADKWRNIGRACLGRKQRLIRREA